MAISRRPFYEVLQERFEKDLKEENECLNFILSKLYGNDQNRIFDRLPTIWDQEIQEELIQEFQTIITYAKNNKYPSPFEQFEERNRDKTKSFHSEDIEEKIGALRYKIYNWAISDLLDENDKIHPEVIKLFQWETVAENHQNEYALKPHAIVSALGGAVMQMLFASLADIKTVTKPTVKQYEITTSDKVIMGRIKKISDEVYTENISEQIANPDQINQLDNELINSENELYALNAITMSFNNSIPELIEEIINKRKSLSKSYTEYGYAVAVSTLQSVTSPLIYGTSLLYNTTSYVGSFFYSNPKLLDADENKASQTADPATAMRPAT